MGSVIADMNTVLERMYDRWAFAMDAVRAGDYTSEEFAKDATEAWSDAIYYCVLPYARIGGLKLEPTTAVPVARVIVLDKTQPKTTVIRVRGGTPPLSLDHLTRANTTDQINNTDYSATVAVNGKAYLFVRIDCPTIDATGLSAGVYEGDVRDSGGDTIARVAVVWPG